MKGNNLKKIGCIVIFLGVLIICIPYILTFFREQNMERDIKYFEKIKNEISDKNKMDLLYKDFKEYNDSIYKNGQQLVDAFSYEDESFDLSKYDIKDEIVGYITIPKIDIRLPIFLGANKKNLSKRSRTLISNIYTDRWRKYK